MRNLNKTNLLFISLSIFVYGILTIICWNHGYFWDNIQLTSIEAHWYYLTDFKSFIVPKYAQEFGIYGTGGPPLLPLITAYLWKIIGYKLWISHAFIAIWAVVLIYNAWCLVKMFFPEEYVGIVLFIILMETSLLTQYAIASPDFILITALIISLRAIFKHDTILLSIGFFFLLNISTRGFFTGSILFFVHLLFNFLQKEEFGKQPFIKTFIAYFPAFLTMGIYISYYIVKQGWFFDRSNFSSAQNLPQSFFFIIKHLCDFGMRLIENGRIIIWFVAFYVLWKTYKTKNKLQPNILFSLVFLGLLTGMYLAFVFLTKMPFLTRYFMPHILLLTIFALDGLFKYLSESKLKFFLILILCFELAGHFWIYPEKITKIWDSTLAHLPFYTLREKCFDYIDKNKFHYKDISSGFCLYDNRRFVELKNGDKIIGRDNNRKYFIYSNISNIPDEWIDELKNPVLWTPIKSFSQGFVIITIYRRI